MSFADPFYLVGLVAVPAAIWWYLGRQRQRRAIARAFTTAPLEPSVMPARPGSRRHLPLLLLLLASVVLILASAGPRVEASVPVSGAAIMLATDVSGSMLATDITPNRVTAAQRAANAFVLRVPREVRVGVMEFNHRPTVLSVPSTNRLDTFAALGRLSPGGGTAAGNAIEAGLGVLSQLHTSNGRRAPGAILLLSDGKTTSGFDPLAAARDARRLHVPVYTVALGTPGGTIAVKRRNGTLTDVRVPPDPSALAVIAQTSGGRSYSVSDAGRLSAVYQNLAAQLGRHQVKQQIAGYFIGSGLVLLLAGSAASLFWFGRLI